MSLQVWLPLTKDLRQQGLSNTTVTNNGTTYSSTGGKLGGNYTSTTTNQTITVNFSNLSTMLANGKTYSLSCWVKPTGIPDNGWVIKLGSNSCGLWWAKSEARWVWNENDNGKRCANPTISGDYTNWHHLAIVVDKTVNGKITTKQYVDGILAANYPGSTWDCSSHSQPTGTTITISPYVSQLNDIRLYDHCLSPMEVKELAKGLVLHYPLNRQGWGQENLLPCGGTYTKDSPWSTTSNKIDGYYLVTNSAFEAEPGETYTISVQCDGNLISSHATSSAHTPSNKDWTFWLYVCNTNTTKSWQTGAYDTAVCLTSANHNHKKIGNTHVWTYTLSSTQKYISLRTNSYSDGSTNLTVNWWNMKIEEGDKFTGWSPNSSSTLATTMGLNSTTEYDCSGFGNNGTKNNITYTSDTPKYVVSSVFNGSNSYIKVNDNNWMVKGMLEMTVNLWAKASTWPTTGRLISCTESGGFNLEAGNSGYWRFPIYVYTNSDQTSSAYKYDSKEIKIADLTPNEWNMITLVYNGDGTKTYINGELHHTYTNTSYGINFNTNARLFLGCEANTASPSSPYFNGNECDFRIYTTALSDDDIKSLYQNSAYIDSSGNIYGAVHEEV